MIAQRSIETLTASVVDMQRNTAELLKAATQSTRVANGIEALERQKPPEVDVEDLADRLDTTIREAGKKQGQPSWLPLASMAMQGVQGFTQAFIAKQKTANARPAPPPRPQTPPPAPPPPPVQSSPPPVQSSPPPAPPRPPEPRPSVAPPVVDAQQDGIPAATSHPATPPADQPDPA
ncbi:MAG: hypothetical protein GY778_25005, partial [bacterium]|nr:hypothetical protein [bacterium]